MKKVLFIIMILSLSSVVEAQEAKNITYSFTLTGEDLQIIGKALDERPFKEVAPLLQKLNTQIQAQIVPNKEKEQVTPQPSPTAK